MTIKGQKLFDSLRRSWTTKDETDLEKALRTCSLICRHAATYCRMQEEQCNVSSYEEGSTKDKREKQIEARIRELCASLPLVQGKVIEPRFQGDPRGATVKLKMPDGRYDDWGQTGICVPGA